VVAAAIVDTVKDLKRTQEWTEAQTAAAAKRIAA
jgi:hypothetical protein